MSNQQQPGSDWPTEPQTAITPPSNVSPQPPRRRRGLWVLSIVLAVILGLGGYVAYALPRTPQGAALLNARDFCSAIQSQNYTKAYDQLSDGLRTLVSRQIFIDISQSVDARDGKVTDCAVTSIDVANNVATVHGTVTRQLIGKQTVTLQYSQVGTNWEMTAPPDPALLPLATADQFCTDLKYQQYDSAYQLLSPAFQAAVSSSANFQQILTGLQQLTGTFIACHVQNVSITKNNQTAKIQGDISFTRLQNIPSIINEVNTSDVWTIDSLTLTILGSPTTFPNNG